jgi:hypothetical protein
MEWNRLISDKRFGLEHYHDPKKSATRTDFRPTGVFVAFPQTAEQNTGVSVARKYICA